MKSATLKPERMDPPEQSRGGRPPKYPWATTPVGHGFYVPQKDGTPTLAALRSAASVEGKKRGMKFSVAGADRRSQGGDAVFLVYRSE